MQAALASFSSHPSRVPPPSETWRVLDDPAEWPSFGHVVEGDAATGRWESQAAVEGMHCAACAFTVEAALLQVPGVLEAQVSAASGRARVAWSAAATRPSRWFEASAAAGYPLMPAGS